MIGLVLLSCYLSMLDSLQKRLFWTIRPSLAASLKPLTHLLIVTSLSFFIGITLVEFVEILNWFHFLILMEGAPNGLYDFSGTTLICNKDVYVNNFFSNKAGSLWNSLPAECVRLPYDLNGYNYRANKHMLSLIVSNQLSYICFSNWSFSVSFSVAWSESQFFNKILKCN